MLLDDRRHTVDTRGWHDEESSRNVRCCISHVTWPGLVHYRKVRCIVLSDTSRGSRSGMARDAMTSGLGDWFPISLLLRCLHRETCSLFASPPKSIPPCQLCSVVDPLSIQALMTTLEERMSMITDGDAEEMTQLPEIGLWFASSSELNQAKEGYERLTLDA